jgi:hypothetical protein
MRSQDQETADKYSAVCFQAAAIYGVMIVLSGAAAPVSKPSLSSCFSLTVLFSWLLAQRLQAAGQRTEEEGDACPHRAPHAFCRAAAHRVWTGVAPAWRKSSSVNQSRATPCRVVRHAILRLLVRSRPACTRFKAKETHASLFWRALLLRAGLHQLLHDHRLKIGMRHPCIRRREHGRAGIMWFGISSGSRRGGNAGGVGGSGKGGREGMRRPQLAVGKQLHTR